MASVRFTTKVKYAGKWYPAHTPFEVKDSDLENLIISGAIVLTAVAPVKKEEDDQEPEIPNVVEPVVTNPEVAPKVEPEITPKVDTEEVPEVNQGVDPKLAPIDTDNDVPTKTELANMTTAELKDYAVKRNVDISGCTNNTQRAATILASFAK